MWEPRNAWERMLEYALIGPFGNMYRSAMRPSVAPVRSLTADEIVEQAKLLDAGETLLTLPATHLVVVQDKPAVHSKPSPTAAFSADDIVEQARLMDDEDRRRREGR